MAKHTRNRASAGTFSIMILAPTVLSAARSRHAPKILAAKDDCRHIGCPIGMPAAGEEA
jgi:hypothetical protein